MRLYLRIIFAVVYTLVYLYFVFILMVDSSFPEIIFPLPTWPLVIVSILLLSKQASLLRRIVIPVLLGVHYVWMIYLLWDTWQWDEFAIEKFKESKDIIIASIVMYLAGQAIIWFVYLTRVKQTGELK